jgi:hypothetical protein
VPTYVDFRPVFSDLIPSIVSSDKGESHEILWARHRSPLRLVLLREVQKPTLAKAPIALHASIPERDLAAYVGSGGTGSHFPVSFECSYPLPTDCRFLGRFTCYGLPSTLEQRRVKSSGTFTRLEAMFRWQVPQLPYISFIYGVDSSIGRSSQFNSNHQQSTIGLYWVLRRFAE